MEILEIEIEEIVSQDVENELSRGFGFGCNNGWLGFDCDKDK